MESNTQGHGTIKKLRTGAVVSALALTAFGVSTGVSASETAVTEPATRVVPHDEVNPKVPCQHDVDNAKAESDKANQDVAKQKEVVTSTESSITNVEKTIADTTKKIEETKSVTPEKVAEAKADADKKANELATAEKTVADADKTVSTTAEKVTNQTKVVETAQTSLDNGKKAQTNKDQAIKDAQSGVSSAESKLSQATKDLANAKAEQTKKEDAVKTAKSALDVAKQGTTETTTYKDPEYRLLKEDKETVYKINYSPALSKGYIDAIKALANGTGTTDAVSNIALKTPYIDEKTGVGASSLRDFNSTGSYSTDGINKIPYGSEDKDATEIVDYQHLTKEQQIQLSFYAASIINELRAKVGTEPLKVTASALKLAESFNNYANAFPSSKGGAFTEHNTKSVAEKLELAKKETEVTTPSLAIRSTMVPDFLGLGKELTTMAHIKQVMYQGIVDALMGTTENSIGNERYSSAMALLGLTNAEKVAIGVGIGRTGSYTTKGYETSITLSVPQSITETTQEVDAKAVQTAQKAYDSAVNELNQAKSTVATVQITYTNTETALANARKELSDLTGGEVDIASLEKAVATAKGELEVLTKAHNVAEKERKLAREELARKREASKEATDTHTVLELALTHREEVLKTLDKELADAKSKLEVLRAELKTAKEELARLEGIAEVKARILANWEQLKADCDAQKQDKVVVTTIVGVKGDKTYQAPAQPTNTKVENKKQLPNTGTKESGLLALLGASVGLLALAGKRKYNR